MLKLLTPSCVHHFNAEGGKLPMRLTVTGKNLDVGSALRDHIENHLISVSEKYFFNPIEATVIISKEAFYFRTDISLHVGRGMVVRCHSNADEPYASVDSAIDRLSQNLRRHKNRLRDHHKTEAVTVDQELVAKQFVLASAEDEAESHPAVIAEMDTKIMPLTVSQAIMHLDFSEQPLLMFQNSATQTLNVVFRRPDGNIGWIDPSLARKAEPN